jgi:ATP-dependent Lon protease
MVLAIASATTTRDGANSLLNVDFDPNDPIIQPRFAELKTLSKEYLALIRLSSILPGARNSSISPILARRLEMYILRKDSNDAAEVSDFMASVLEGAHEDKLLVLASLDVSVRLRRVIDILQKQITKLQNPGRAISAVGSTVGLDLNKLKDLRSRNGSSVDSPFNGLPPSMGGFGGAGQDDANELEELKKKLDDAGLSPEASKVANREMARLQKMSPAQAEYQVCRN